MDPRVATLPISLQIQPKWLRLGLGSGDLKNPSPFPPQTGRLRFSRRPSKHLCLLGEGNRLSSWDEKPYEILPGGRISYLDEQDIATFVDPPKELIPLDPESYNPAAYLWKKLGDIPEERRQRLLASLKPKHIPKIWELTGTRYQDAKLAKQAASTLLSMDANSPTPEYWRCRTSKGGSLPSTVSNFFGPLYFTVRQVTEIVSTEQSCDLAYEFGNGLLGLSEFPEGFPIPAKHPWPFNDHLVIYIRHAGSGVVVGQAWQEGNDLDQVPKKLCGEILMVKDYISSL